MGPLEDTIADCVLKAFNDLPASRKPRIRQDAHEWVPLSGIVLGRDEEGHDLTCVALGTGMGCLPAPSLRFANGIVLHDWHAEILAIRAFNLFLLRECQNYPDSSVDRFPVVRFRSLAERRPDKDQPFGIVDGVRIYMYSSEAPCGDVSMHLTIASSMDATPWERTRRCSGPSTSPARTLHGRDNFHVQGVVRTKPSRSDAPLTTSKSCTDKLSLRSFLSLLSSPASLCLDPSNAYLHALVIPASEYSSAAAERAFGPNGRLSSFAGPADSKVSGGYSFHPIKVSETSQEFAYSRRAGGDKRLVGSDITTLAIPTHGIQQTLTKGRLRGRREGDPLGGSAVCRREIWKIVQEIVRKNTASQAIRQAADGGPTKTYQGLKQSAAVACRAEGKSWVTSDGNGLEGWGDSANEDVKWSLEGAVSKKPP